MRATHPFAIAHHIAASGLLRFFGACAMMEALWALGLVLALGAVTAVELVAWARLIEIGQALMLTSAAVGIPLEMLYFLLLGRALSGHPQCPQGWYWRSFAHHHLLSRGQRLWVLPWFYLGALGFLGIAMGIGLVLVAFVAAARQS